MVKDEIVKLIKEALKIINQTENWDIESFTTNINVEIPPQKSYGDYATNIAMVLSKVLKKPPKDVAEKIASPLQDDLSAQAEKIIEKIEIAPPGFINFYLKNDYLYKILGKILREKENFGKQNVGSGQKVLIEFVSANPTGPLHVGNGRGGAIGDTLARVLKFLGYKVSTEYYVNDADTGTQIEKLSQSLEVRYLQILGEKVEMPEDTYAGNYIIEIAKNIVENEGDVYLNLPSAERQKKFKELALKEILKNQKEDLKAFNVEFDSFFHEQYLYEENKVKDIIEKLKSASFIYEKEKALWFISSKYGDEKDRVIIRADGKPTYLAADIAYHANKLERGFEHLINIWGADHHGYVARLRAGIAALGRELSNLEIIIYQLVNLTEAGEPVRMSKRTGELITLREVIDEVGKDAARFFFLMRDANSTLDFDLEVAKRESLDNPVYYVQYAYCRCCSIFAQAKERGITYPKDVKEINFKTLGEEEEIELIKKLARVPEEIVNIGRLRNVSRLPTLAIEIAQSFHSFYQKHRVLGEDKELTYARLGLVSAVKIIMGILSDLIGISKREVM